jgi:hypothetical protein
MASATVKKNNSAKKSAPLKVATAPRLVSATKSPARSSTVLRVPITNAFDGNDYSARILIGSQKVAANVILDTGSSTLAVTPAVYNAAKDTDMTATALAQLVGYGTGGWLGPVVDTSLVLGDPEGDSASLSNAPLAVAVSQMQNNFTGVDGIMGLAFNSLNTAYNLSGYLKANKVNPPVTFPWPFPAGNFTQAARQFAELAKGIAPSNIEPYFTELESKGLTMNKFAFYTLRSWVRKASANSSAIMADPWNNGIFVLGGGEQETDLFTGEFVNVDVLHDVYYNVNLISTQVGARPAVKAQPLQSRFVSQAASNCIIDTGTNPLVLAADVYRAILESLERINPKFISIIQQAATAGISSSLLNLDEWPGISFIVTGDSGQQVKLTCSPQTYWQQDFPGPGMSVFQITGGQATGANQSILGLPLMNNYYTVFDRSLGAGKGIIRFAPIKLPDSISEL